MLIIKGRAFLTSNRKIAGPGPFLLNCFQRLYRVKLLGRKCEPMLLLFRMLCFCFVIQVPFTSIFGAENQAVTYHLTGRLGNNLIAYFHAKWISYKYNLPLMYKPFDHSDEFALHDLEENLLEELDDTFEHRKTLENISLLKIDYPNTLFVIPYFRDVGPQPEKRVPIRFYVDWDDPGFKDILRTHLMPRFPVDTISPPKGKINVLVHIRTGGDFDRKQVKLKLPLKFPPLSYYANALRKVSAHYNHAPIYAFILTDDSNPQRLAKAMRQQLPKRGNIAFDWRKGEVGHNVKVLDDFFTIPNFQCLIRADSTFSEMAARLGDFDIIVSPVKGHVENDRVVIDQIEFNKRK